MTEHYVTLFNRAFLPQGLALVESLRRHAGPFTLWVLAMDDIVARVLPEAGPEIRVIPLAEVETVAHAGVKSERSIGEWCWTMTPATFAAVFDRCPEARRVTYVDADVWFLRSPAPLFAELESSSKGVLITDHRYDPQYDRSADCGRFCVQFLTVVNTPQARAVIDWWNSRCIEWCFARFEPGRFGDQKYLDQWPTRFGAVVHELADPLAFTAPWNHRMVMAARGNPVFHHFHEFRLVEQDRFLWWHLYRLGPGARTLYAAYQEQIQHGLAWCRPRGIEPVRFANPYCGSPYRWAKGVLRQALGSIHLAPARIHG